jgi:hypothetical protein
MAKGVTTMALWCICTSPLKDSKQSNEESLGFPRSPKKCISRAEITGRGTPTRAGCPRKEFNDGDFGS